MSKNKRYQRKQIQPVKVQSMQALKNAIRKIMDDNGLKNNTLIIKCEWHDSPNYSGIKHANHWSFNVSIFLNSTANIKQFTGREPLLLMNAVNIFFIEYAKSFGNGVEDVSIEIDELPF